MSYETFDFHTIAYFEVFNGATEDGIQLLDGDSDNVDEIGVIVRVTGYWEAATYDLPGSSSRDIEVVGIELGWKGSFTDSELPQAEVDRIALLLHDDLEANSYNEGGVV